MAFRRSIRRLVACSIRVAYLTACCALLGAILPRASVANAQDWLATPDPVAVDLDSSTTAYLVLDMVETVCGPRPACTGMVPQVADVLARARAAGALVVFTAGRNGGDPVAGLVAMPDDPWVASSADKFFNTNLDEILASHGIKTVVLAGVAANGAPMYTAFSASNRGYTSVILSDGLAADGLVPDEDVAVAVARWQLLHQPGSDNPNNTPLVDGRPTLSRSDLVSFH